MQVRRGCLMLPDPGSCYAATAKQAIPRGYGRKQRARMLDKYIVSGLTRPPDVCWNRLHAF